MRRQGSFMERITKVADLTDEPIPGLPLIELAGDRRVLVENHCGITAYTSCRICIRLKIGTLCVTGCGLQIARMTKQQLVICGRIDGITVHREGN